MDMRRIDGLSAEQSTLAVDRQLLVAELEALLLGLGLAAGELEAVGEEPHAERSAVA